MSSPMPNGLHMSPSIAKEDMGAKMADVKTTRNLKELAFIALY
jgi:hypothetical protein